MRDFRSEHKALLDQIKALHDQEKDLRDAWVEAECPVKVGQITKVNGFSYRGYQMQVTHVSLRHNRWSSISYAFVAKGNVLKKDGTVGSREAESIYELTEEK